MFLPYEGEATPEGRDLQVDRTEMAISELAQCLTPFGYAQPIVAFLESPRWIRRHEAAVDTWLGTAGETAGLVPIDTYTRSAVKAFNSAATSSSVDRALIDRL